MSQHEIKKLHSKLSFLLLSLLLAIYGSSISADTYYRWQDNEGSPHYGDNPPESAIKPQRLDLALQRPLYVVNKVIDGDTIVVSHVGKVRLLGINTPEIAHRDRAAEPLGNRAHQRLKQLLEGKRVYLEFDQQRHDRYQRLLAHVTLEDGTRLNELLLHEGLARAMFLPPNMRYLHEYYRIEAEAQKAQRGIWRLAEYQVRPASRVEECIKRFCRLRGTVRRIEQKRYYTYLYFSGSLLAVLRNQQLPQFLDAGVDINTLKGKSITIRGWVGLREGKPYISIMHTLQIQ